MCHCWTQQSRAMHIRRHVAHVPMYTAHNRALQGCVHCTALTGDFDNAVLVSTDIVNHPIYTIDLDRARTLLPSASNGTGSMQVRQLERRVIAVWLSKCWEQLTAVRSSACSRVLPFSLMQTCRSELQMLVL